MKPSDHLAVVMARVAAEIAVDMGDCPFCGDWERTKGRRHDPECLLGQYLKAVQLEAKTPAKRPSSKRGLSAWDRIRDDQDT